jgi:hypothetical protein
MTTARSKPEPMMCVVEINHMISLAMPIDSGLAIVRLLKTACEVSNDYGGPHQGMRYRAIEGLAVSLKTIDASQIVKIPLARPKGFVSPVSPASSVEVVGTEALSRGKRRGVAADG